MPTKLIREDSRDRHVTQRDGRLICWCRRCNRVTYGRTKCSVCDARPKLEVPRKPARTSDPDTSQEAAQAVLEDPRTGTLMAEILEVYRARGPMATFECAQAMPEHDREQIWKRCSDLLSSGHLRDTGERILGPKGRRVYVLEVAQ